MPCLDGGPRCERDEREDLVDELIDYVNDALVIDMNEQCINLDEKTDYLCRICKVMSVKELNKIMYNGRNKNARKLADWWDKHQEEDIKRQKKEEKAKKQIVLRKQAWNKLSPAEREAWGLDFNKFYGGK